MSAQEQLQYAEHVKRIEALIAWNQPVNEPDFVFYRDHLLTVWNEQAATLAAAKASEMELRQKIVKLCGNPAKTKGTEYAELGNGYRLKIVKKQNVGFIKGSDGKKVDKGAVDSALSAIEKRSASGGFIAQELVKWKPELSLTMYEKLDTEDAAIIDKVIVTSPGSPELEIVPPKGK